jgi:hypothetical protein
MADVPRTPTALKLKPDVVFRRLDEGGVLVDLTTNQIYELNHTAARIWEILREEDGSPCLLDRLAEEFEVDPDTADREVQTLIDDLRGEGLLDQ